jgi:hypothetical protein
LLPIIGHNSGNQHTTIISFTLYYEEFFNRIGQNPPFASLIDCSERHHGTSSVMFGCLPFSSFAGAIRFPVFDDVENTEKIANENWTLLVFPNESSVIEPAGVTRRNVLVLGPVEWLQAQIGKHY